MTNEPFSLACDVLQLLSAGFLGLLVGALMAEGALLVPYWRTLSPQEFYALHPSYGPRLFRFFAPLTIAGPSLSLVTAGVSIGVADPGQWFSVVSAAMSMVVIGIYFAYFKSTNAAFERAAIPESGLAAELGRWAAWHKGRTVIALVAFAGSLLALHRW